MLGGPFTVCDIVVDMRLSRDGKLIRTDIWREGEYLDLWSVPHFLSGILVAFTLYFFQFEARSAFVIGFLFLVAYEMFEVIVKIEETRWNRVLDVVVGMASLVPTFFALPLIPVSVAYGLFGVIALINAVLSFLGWRESQKAAVLEAKMRVELRKERERFMRRRHAIAANWKNRRAQWRKSPPSNEGDPPHSGHGDT